MEQIGALLKKIREHGTDTTSSWNEQTRMDIINASQGSLTGYDCPDCKNRGYHAVLSNGMLVTRECSCIAKRRTLRHMKASGLLDLLEDYTFAAYQTPETWQAEAKRKAQAYLSDNQKKWFVACGTVGSGKSHLCTAICGEFLNAGKRVRYMRWRDDSIRLKAAITDEHAYDQLIRPLKQADVLYIDDFFKTEKGVKPSSGDINLAFELLNYRYTNKNMPTIISCERTVAELLTVDEAVGSRIYERCKTTCVSITGNKNWRLRT